MFGNVKKDFSTFIINIDETDINISILELLDVNNFIDSIYLSNVYKILYNIYIDNTYISDEGINAIGGLLKVNNSIKSIDLSNFIIFI